MKFESPINIGQKVIRANQVELDNPDQMEVLQIGFNTDGFNSYLCESINTGNREYYLESQLLPIGFGDHEGAVFESKMGLREIVIRESHKNGEMIQERMMEVVSIFFSCADTIKASYLCEDAQYGNRQIYSESMLVGDPDFDQEKGAYPISPEETQDTNAIPVEA